MRRIFLENRRKEGAVRTPTPNADLRPRRSVHIDRAVSEVVARIAYVERRSIQAQTTMLLSEGVQAWIKRNGEPPLLPSEQEQQAT